MQPFNFTLPLLQAVSDWQRGTPDEKQRLNRGIRLKAACVGLPAHFKEVHLTCMRQVALEKGSVWNLLGKQCLSGRVSSWTTDMEVAKAFLGGVPAVEDGLTHIIFAQLPTAEQIVVNLDKLLADLGYQAALSANKKHINFYEAGTGRYGNSQAEVILDIESHEEKDIWAFGGWSSSFESLVRQAYEQMHGHRPNAQEYDAFYKTVQVMEGKAGARWLQQESTQRVLDRTRPEAEKLAALVKLREANREKADQEVLKE